MNIKSTAKSARQIIQDPLETLTSQVAKPILDEALSEFGAFFGTPKNLGTRPKSIAQEELARARHEQELNELKEKDEKNSHDHISKIVQEYKMYDAKTDRQNETLKQEVEQLQEEVVKLAKTAGVDTKAHLENVPQKVGVLHIKMLTTIIRYLRIKAEESKSAQELQSQRQNAKRSTGMLAWVSGKQMKVHEQGTLQLQG